MSICGSVGRFLLSQKFFKTNDGQMQYLESVWKNQSRSEFKTQLMTQTDRVDVLRPKCSTSFAVRCFNVNAWILFFLKLNRFINTKI